MKKVFALFAAVFILALAGTGSASDVQASGLQAALGIGGALEYYTFFETVAEMDEAKEVKGFRIPGTTRRLAVIVSGVVVCRFDSVNVEFIYDDEARVLMVRLPHAKLYKVVPDLDSARVYDQKKGLFAQALTLKDQNRLLANTKDIITERAVSEWKLPEKAEDNARNVILALAKGMGYKATVEFIGEAK